MHDFVFVGAEQHIYPHLAHILQRECKCPSQCRLQVALAKKTAGSQNSKKTMVDDDSDYAILMHVTTIATGFNEYVKCMT